MLHRYATLTAIATFLLLIAGGLVTSTDSGLAVPDWPLAYGMWFPPMVGGILYEHGHRMIAAVVGLMILALAVWLRRVESRRWVRRLGDAALAAVVVQALLGGLTVLLLLPPVVSIAHACLGQIVLCLVAALAYGISSRWVPAVSLDGRAGATLRLLGLAVGALAALQLVLGAVIRHTGYAVLAHIVGAVSLALVTLLAAGRVSVHRQRLASAAPHAWRLAALVGAQLLLGFAVFAHRGMLALRTAHQATGALILAQAMLLAWEVVRATTSKSSKPISDIDIRYRYLISFLELTKPRLSLLVLVTTGVGYWLGSSVPFDEARWLLTMVGTALVVGGANALNQWMEREADGLMSRTQHRPLPAGRLHPASAHRFGVWLIIIGVAVLGLGVNLLSAALALISALLYLLAYTPLKRRTSLCTLVGAIPGALPPMIGWAAARNALGIEAWVLFALLFVWQLPHFLAIAVLYREDYARAGFKMLPVIESDGWATARQTALYGLALVPVSLFPTLIGLSGGVYFCGALALSAGFLLLSVRSALVPSRASARQLFIASVAYLPTLMTLLGLDKVPG